MNADQIIKCILGTMLKLEKTVDSNLNDKLDRGGYQGNAQDLSDSIESIYQPDTVIRYTAPTRVGNTFTFPNGGYDVLLSKQFHTNTSELETTIAAATDGFKRIDLVYFKSDNTISKIQGTESATVAVRPEVPAGGRTGYICRRPRTMCRFPPRRSRPTKCRGVRQACRTPR